MPAQSIKGYQLGWWAHAFLLNLFLWKAISRHFSRQSFYRTRGNWLKTRLGLIGVPSPSPTSTHAYTCRPSKRHDQIPSSHPHIPCGTKFLREFIFADWRFLVFCGKNLSGNFYLRELIFVPWVPEDIFFLIDIGLFHLRYFENGPLEPGIIIGGSLKKSQKFPVAR